ncbi:uncharacterized protein LOC106462568 [Limulus polyphemus]|uniref:Uncharacterized protein LOC106462568 n=1 Tax=Limulus polyphemus TaxID=6850 RepID=A0ABM1BA92_LIMPO|nr:uncharacterized protein LOC106462568 [Limulus polyphemus]
MENKVNVFHRKCLRKILKISYRDHVRNEEVLRRAGQRDLQESVNKRRLRFAGHVLRMPVSRPANKSMEWVPPNLRRGRERPKKTWRRTFKEDLELVDLTFDQAVETAHDRGRWLGLADQCSQRNGRN